MELFRQFFLGQPRELEEAARVDGCGFFRTFTRVVLPVAKSVYVVVLVLDLIALKYIVPEVGSYLRVFAKPAAAGIIMGAGAWAVYGLLERALIALGMVGETGAQTLSRTGNAVAAFSAIGAAVIVYFVLVLLTRAISKEDLLLMPKGEKIAKILHF